MGSDDFIGEDTIFKIYDTLAREVFDDNLDNELGKVRKLPRAVRAIYTTVKADNEVLNGGFHQYFWNPSGFFAEEAAEDFTLIDDHKRSEIVRYAIQILFDEKEMQLKARRKRSPETFSEAAKRSQLHLADDEYYALQLISPLDELLAEHVRRTIQLFQRYK